VGYSLGGMIALKLIAEHPDRVLSGTLGGMGWMREGSFSQKIWELMPTKEEVVRTPAACINSMGKLAITEEQLKTIKTPMIVLVGDRDPIKKLYVAPLQKVRKDWTVVEIPNAGHIICVLKKEFTKELVKWVDKNGDKE
jgi:pimeloyl-ACP methyl ester carboxylesterase